MPEPRALGQCLEHGEERRHANARAEEDDLSIDVEIRELEDEITAGPPDSQALAGPEGDRAKRPRRDRARGASR